MAPRKRKAERSGDDSPTHVLKMKTTSRDGGGWSRVGVGWENSNGLCSVRLNRGVVLDWHDFEAEGGFVLILVPAD